MIDAENAEWRGHEITPVAGQQNFADFEIIVRLDDLAQAILQRAVAAIGVGMVALHQFLEARLDLGRGRVDLQPERVERLALGIANRAGFRRGPLGARPRPAPEFAQHLERIARSAAP